MVLLFCIACVVLSCSKNGDDCWTCRDTNAVDVREICNKSQWEIDEIENRNKWFCEKN
jgi:hypothetical protein